jgi:hypothetical protein
MGARKRVHNYAVWGGLLQAVKRVADGGKWRKNHGNCAEKACRSNVPVQLFIFSCK